MKVAIVLNTNDAENVWNALRLANTLLLRGHEVKLFLMGRGVEVAGSASGEFDVEGELERFSKLGGELLACGTCVKLRGYKSYSLCPMSTMIDLAELVEKCDKVITF